MGIGPTRPAWKAGILPLNYTRTYHIPPSHRQRLYIIALLKKIVKQFSRFFEKISYFFYFFKNHLILFPYFLKMCYNIFSVSKET